jgi:ribonuclease Z
MESEKSKKSTLPIWSVWDGIVWPIPLTNLILQGFSLAGLRTNFVLNKEILLDAGLTNPFNVSTVLVTHGHSDHIANLPFVLYNSTQISNKHIKIYCPEEIVELLDNYIKSMYRLSDANPDFSPGGYTVVGVKPGDQFEVITKGSKYQIDVFECVHRVPCVGYAFGEIKNKLDPKYIGLGSNQIKSLKDSGVEITQQICTNQFVFLGDTTHEIFDLNPQLLNYSNIVIECTFLHSEDISNALEKKHICWTLLEPYVRANPNVTWILIHFSARYKKEDIEEFFAGQELSNIKLWLNY